MTCRINIKITLRAHKFTLQVRIFLRIYQIKWKMLSPPNTNNTAMLKSIRVLTNLQVKTLIFPARMNRLISTPTVNSKVKMSNSQADINQNNLHSNYKAND